jgi:hypothetical protein
VPRQPGDLQQRRLSGARRPDNDEKLSLVDGKNEQRARKLSGDKRQSLRYTNVSQLHAAARQAIASQGLRRVAAGIRCEQCFSFAKTPQRWATPSPGRSLRGHVCAHQIDHRVKARSDISHKCRTAVTCSRRGQQTPHSTLPPTATIIGNKTASENWIQGIRAPEHWFRGWRTQSDEKRPVADALADRHIAFVFATEYTIAQVPGRHANVPRFEKPTAPGVICRALEGQWNGGDGSPRG